MRAAGESFRVSPVPPILSLPPMTSTKIVPQETEATPVPSELQPGYQRCSDLRKKYRTELTAGAFSAGSGGVAFALLAATISKENIESAEPFFWGGAIGGTAFLALAGHRFINASVSLAEYKRLECDTILQPSGEPNEVEVTVEEADPFVDTYENPFADFASLPESAPSFAVTPRAASEVLQDFALVALTALAVMAGGSFALSSGGALPTTPGVVGLPSSPLTPIAPRLHTPEL